METKLYKGIFWIVNIDEINSDTNRNYIFKLECDKNGDIINAEDYELDAKSGTTYNHKLHWESLPKDLKQGVEYNYYPRGRVEIRNEIATIYANPNICTDGLRYFITEEFGLIETNGIKKVNLKADGSEHYKCCLDEII